MSDWENQCVLCAARGKQTKVQTGHCCLPCAAWLATTVADIARLAADAAAWVAPGSTTGGGGRSVPSSRPPLTVDAVDPELTLIGPAPSPSVLEVLESWERMTREMREMAPYGPASAARAHAIAASAPGGLYAGTSATLVGCVDFLGRQVVWMGTEPDFPLEDFADEMRACVRVLRRWDVDRDDMGTMVKCPTLGDAGECGYRLYYVDVHEDVTCRRCGATRSAMTLAAVAMADGRDVWLDPEAASQYLGVSEATLRRMARKGVIKREHSRYLMPHSTISERVS